MSRRALPVPRHDDPAQRYIGLVTLNLLAWGFFRFFDEVVRAGWGEEFRLVLWVSLGLPFVPVCETLPRAVGVPLWLSNPFVWAAAVEFGLRWFVDRPRDSEPD